MNSFMKKLKKKVYLILDVSDYSSKLSRLFNSFLIVLICLNVLAVSLETVESLYKEYKAIFYGFEIFSVIIFTVEFLLRIWAITEEKKFKCSTLSRIRFLFTFDAMVDLLAILPFYLPMIIGFDMRFIRVLRLFRLIRIMKISRYMHATTMIGNVFKNKKEELGICILLISFLMIVISSIMFNIEHDAQPDKFSSIPATIWWSVATLTSAGIGDIYPITILGKTLASIISILGIGIVALPAGILASGFMNELNKKNKTQECKCPHCGKEI